MRISGITLLAALVAIGCGPTDSAAPAPEAATLSSINETIFLPKCTTACHSGGSEVAAGGLDMQGDPRAAMLDVPATAVPCTGAGQKRLVAGDPEASLLYTKVASKAAGQEPPCGEGMPLGADRPALSAAELEQLRAWIADGASDD